MLPAEAEGRAVSVSPLDPGAEAQVIRSVCSRVPSPPTVCNDAHSRLLMTPVSTLVLPDLPCNYFFNEYDYLMITLALLGFFKLKWK